MEEVERTKGDRKERQRGKTNEQKADEKTTSGNIGDDNVRD